MEAPIEYKDELDYNHDVTGKARIRAEINWNQTKFLAEQAKRGSHIRVFDSTGVAVSNAATFAAAFAESRLKKELYHSTVNWYESNNKPALDWMVPPRNPQSFKFWGAEQTFYVDIFEAGTWKWFVSSDDSHELYIYNQAGVATKVTSHYGGRLITFPPDYSESGTYTFATPGRYKVVAKLHNIDVDWGIFLGYQSPSMIAGNVPPAYVDGELVIRPDQLTAPNQNPLLVGYDKNAASVKAWKEWREYFPLSSVVGPLRPTSGLRYNELNGDAVIMTPLNYIVADDDSPKVNHWHLMSKGQHTYKYWKSDQMSSNTGNQNAGYPINGAEIIIQYNEPVGVNKVLTTFNMGPKPVSMTIEYADENGVWNTIVSATDPIPTINPNTGEVILYINSDGQWTYTPEYEGDYSIQLTKLRVKVNKINRPSARVEIIEIAAMKELDITDRTISLNAELSMEELDFMAIVGTVSSNSGTIEISDWDKAFDLGELDEISSGPDKLKNIAERQVKFTAEVLYDLHEQNYGPRYHAVPMFTMYAHGWKKDGEFDYTVDLFDSAKYLQNIECPDLYLENQPVHIILAQILDSVGFGKYRFDKEDYSATSPKIDYFANVREATVWETIQSLCQATFCAVFVDQDDMLQLITRDKITKAELPDHTLRGQYDEDNPEKLPNIVSLDKAYEQEANKVKITWKPKAIKTDKNPVFPQELTDIMWQTNDTITLQASRITKDIAYDEENSFWIDEKKAETWQYSGRGNINGEMIAWEGKEYYFRVLLSNPGQPDRYEFQTKVIFSQEEKLQCDSLSKSGQYQMTNKFTGKILFKRQEKTNLPKGRGIDSSKYRVRHPVNRRPGWIDARCTIGQPGIIPGFWPGEQSTSWYTATGSPNQTSIEINRPTNRSDDWFKNQILMRSSSPGQNLQQWGARIKFKESTTIGELNFMFNMGQSFGNSEVVTTAIPALFNQYYQVSFLETTNLVRDATHEISAWVVSPDPVYRTFDNAIRGSASRMYNRNYWQSWKERMQGYSFEFKRDVWYDIRIDLTRGRGYQLNSDMHFFVWVNGTPAGGFNAAGPANRHKWLAPTNYWAIGSRAASKVEVEHAYTWTEFDVDEGTLQTYEDFRWDYANGGYLSTHLEDGLLYPSKGKTSPYRDGAQFNGEFFFDDFGGMVHEIRDFEVNLDKAPARALKTYISNPGVRELEMNYSPNKCKFSVVNVTNKDAIAHGTEDLTGGAAVNHVMLLYGYALTEEEEKSITRQNTESIKDRGEVKLDLTPEWVNTKEQAEELAKWVIQNFADPKDVIDVEVFPDMTYRIGEKVNIIYDKGNIDRQWLYIISKITHNYGENGLETNLSLRRVRNNYVPSDDEM